MRTRLLIGGVLLFGLFATFALVAYGAVLVVCRATAVAPHAGRSFTCVEHWGILWVALILLLIALVVIIAGAVLAPLPSPAATGSILTKCGQCGTFYTQPVPDFCPQCGSPVGVAHPPVARAAPSPAVPANRGPSLDPAEPERIAGGLGDEVQ